MISFQTHMIKRRLIFYSMLPLFFSQTLKSEEWEKFHTKIPWSTMQTFPKALEFEGEVQGYLSIFKVNESWHIYLYKSREALRDHDENSFVQVLYSQFGETLGIHKFVGNEALLKSLDSRYIKMSGVFRTSSSSVSNVPFYADKVFKIEWRNKRGKWTSDKENGLSESSLTAGRLLKFPAATFFKHSVSPSPKKSESSSSSPKLQEQKNKPEN